jgi:hypothetical protein
VSEKLSMMDMVRVDGIKYFRLRAGAEHRFIAVWVVVVNGRIFVRPWYDKKDGWYRAFLKQKTGAIQVDTREFAVRARAVRGMKINDAIDAAYAAKYTTKANKPYVKGFATAKRRATTLELIPV